MQETSEQLSYLLRVKYNVLDDANAISICPASLASAVLEDIDPKIDAPLLVRIAALLELKELARKICRALHTESERATEAQGSLFPMLQARYPAARASEGGEVEDVYVSRENLTLAERYRNILRLRSESQAKQKHADALLAETDHLVRTGLLMPEAADQTEQKWLS